jgi:hypothetical protein
MCLRSQISHFFTCGHLLPMDVCEYYAIGIVQCLSNQLDPAKPLVFDSREMLMIDIEDTCLFCKRGWNINVGGEYEWGKKWHEAAQFRKKT